MQLGERNWTEIGGLTGRVAVVPLGSLEQHGHHLPLLTDTLIGGEIARRAQAELDDALFAAAAGEVVAFVREFGQWPTIPPH